MLEVREFLSESEQVVRDNRIIVRVDGGDIDLGLLSDDEVRKLVSIVRGFQADASGTATLRDVAKKAEPKVYTAEAGEYEWTQDGKFVKHNAYIDGHKKVLNKRIREAGGVWDSEKRKYAFPSKAKADAFVKTSADVSVEEHAEVIAKAAARQAKKGN